MNNNIFESKASDAYERACIPQIAKYIESLGYDSSEIYSDDGSIQLSPLIIASDMKKIRAMNSKDFSTTGIGSLKKQVPTKAQQTEYKEKNQIHADLKLHQELEKKIPNFEQYSWFIIHTGASTSNSDILVAHRDSRIDNLNKQWAIQNIEIKRYASSYLFQPQMICSLKLSNGTLNIKGLSHAYLDQFDSNTSELNDIFMTALLNDNQYQKAMSQITNAHDVNDWLDKFLNGKEYKVLIKDIAIPNVEEVVKKFYFDGYDMNRQVTVFQIGNGKNARLFKVSGVKSTPQIDPLKLLNNKTNSFSSAFNTILFSIEVRKMNGKNKVFGKIRFSNKKATAIGSFDPKGTLPS